jgi:hypothetical protein
MPTQTAPPRHCWRCGAELSEGAVTCFLCHAVVDLKFAASSNEVIVAELSQVAPRGMASFGQILSHCLFWLLAIAIPVLGLMIWYDNRNSPDVWMSMFAYGFIITPPLLYAGLRGYGDWRRGHGFDKGAAVLRFIAAAAIMYAIGVALVVAALIALFVTCLSQLK